MNPGAIVLYLTRGEPLPEQVWSIPGVAVHMAEEYEWMFLRDKLKWFEELYRDSTNEKPLGHLFQCTTLDLLNHLKPKMVNSTTNTMVQCVLMKKKELVGMHRFFI